jgi:hypothetical protein
MPVIRMMKPDGGFSRRRIQRLEDRTCGGKCLMKPVEQTGVSPIARVNRVISFSWRAGLRPLERPVRRVNKIYFNTI